MLSNNFKSDDVNIGFFRRHPVFSNVLVIITVAFVGIWIVYFSLQLFTRHGTSDTVPRVENMSYTDAIKLLHAKGFRVDIRDSLYNDAVKPGYVVEQFPRAGNKVKPGRKVFLYINAVHPREMVVDVDNNPAQDALHGYSFRQGMARLEELGFKKISIRKVQGDNDRIIRVLANGNVVKKMQKIPVTADIIVEVCDGELSHVNDSIRNEEYLQMIYGEDNYPEVDYTEDGDDGNYYENDDLEDMEPVFVQ